MVAKTRRKAGRKTATRRKPAARRKTTTQRKAGARRRTARARKRAAPLIVGGDGLLMPPAVVVPTRKTARNSARKRKAKTGLGRLLDAIT